MPGNSGGELGAAFYDEIVGPLITGELPRLRHAAARLGSGGMPPCATGSRWPPLASSPPAGWG
jgi:hypothetical protein